MLCIVPPDSRSEGLGGQGSPLTSSSSVASASGSPWRSCAASAASSTPRSAGSDSKPLTCTTFTPASAAGASNSSIVRRTNGISPVRST